MVEMGNFPKFNFKSWCVLLSWLYWSFACKSKCIKCNNIEFASTTHIRVIRLRLWESDFINLFELIQFYLSKQQANSANLWIRSDKEISKWREGDDRETGPLEYRDVCKKVSGGVRSRGRENGTEGGNGRIKCNWIGRAYEYLEK